VADEPLGDVGLRGEDALGGVAIFDIEALTA